MANIFLNQYNRALQSFRNYLKSLNLIKPTNLSQCSTVYVCVSMCLFNSGHPHQALGWLFEALEICNLLSISSQQKLVCYDIASNCYKSLGYLYQANRWENMSIEKLSGKDMLEK